MKNKNIKKTLLVIALLVLVCSCSNNQQANEEQNVISNETVIQDNSTNDNEQTIEEVVEETKENEPIVVPNNEPKVSSYKLHVGIAEGISLTVDRIYSEYGPVGEVKPEVTKLYEGDILRASATTNFNLEPIYCVHDATKNDDNTFTIERTDATVTTGYRSVSSSSLIPKQNLYIEYNTRDGTKIKFGDTIKIDSDLGDMDGIYQFDVNVGQIVNIDVTAQITMWIERYNVANGETISDKVPFATGNSSFYTGDNTTNDTYFTIEDGYNYYIKIDKQVT